MAILDGIRVIDWTHAHVGPSAGAMLADLGADVIHVEELGRGDHMRGLINVKGVCLLSPTGRHYCFEDLNRNKKSLAIDLKKPRGREIIYRLAEKSDVFLTNMRAAAGKKLGMDSANISKYNPKIIYASANFLGAKGDEAGRAGIELSAYARSGAMASSGEREGPPVYLTPGMGDRITGIFLAYGVLAALFAREKQGVVQEVSTSMLGAMVTLESFSVMAAVLGGKPFERHSRQNTANPLYNWYITKDGPYIALALLQDERYWPRFCKAIDMPKLEHDPRFASTQARANNRKELIALLERVFASRTYDEWHSALVAQDLLFDRINNISDLADDPQCLINGNIIEWDHPVLGRVKTVGFPVQFSKTPLSIRNCAPEVGEHTEEVLTETCGYTWDEIAKLRDEGVV